MKFPFQPLPGERILRPVVSVSFPKIPNFKIPALVDSGAVATRINDQLVGELELEVPDVQPTVFYVGGRGYHSRTVVTDLSVGKDTRPCEIDFVEDWNYEHALLGIRGFFQNYIVTIDARSKMVRLKQRHNPS